MYSYGPPHKAGQKQDTARYDDDDDDDDVHNSLITTHIILPDGLTYHKYQPIYSSKYTDKHFIYACIKIYVFTNVRHTCMMWHKVNF